MPLATSQSQYGETTDIELPAAVLAKFTPEEQALALKKASATADSYLGNRFHLPLLSYGEDLVQRVGQIAAYWLVSKRGFSPQAGDSEQLRIQYEDAVGWFKDVSKGLATPIGIVDSAAPANQTPSARSGPTEFALQPQGDTVNGYDFWDKDGTSIPGGLGPPKRRGW